MSQELFNQLLANSPIVGVLLWYARKLTDIAERLAKMEGIIYARYYQSKNEK